METKRETTATVKKMVMEAMDKKELQLLLPEFVNLSTLVK